MTDPRRNIVWLFAVWITVGISIAGSVRADESGAVPSPDAEHSHEAFKKLLDGSRATTYGKILAIYDAWLEAHPRAVTAAIERCRFMMAASSDDSSERIDEEPAALSEDCAQELLKRFPDSAEVVGFRAEGLWGKSAIEFGEATLARRDISWHSDARRAQFIQHLAFAYLSQSDEEHANTWAERARALDPKLDLGVILAKRMIAHQERSKAIAELTLPNTDAVHGGEKVQLLIELHAYKQALELIDSLAKSNLPVGPLLHAEALAGAGDRAGARAECRKLANQPWQRQKALEHLFHMDLERGNRALAAASYAALRDTGFAADPLARHRLALALKFPSARWHARDLLGLLALIGLGLAFALVPLVWLLPVHYSGCFAVRARQ